MSKDIPLEGTTKITDDGLYRCHWEDSHIYGYKLIISKEDFIKCYNAWIKGCKWIKGDTNE